MDTESQGGNREYGYRKLKVWQKADEFAFGVYVESRKFPKEELYGLTSQLRRAAVSVPANIAEGTGRQGRSELRQFLNIALGSLAETEYLLHLSHKLGYLGVQTYERLDGLRQHVGALLRRFYRSLHE